MLGRRLRWREAVDHLIQQLEAMPDYSIYREFGGGYIIYTDGIERRFASEAEARIAQLAARAVWLRAHSTRPTATAITITADEAPQAVYPDARNAYGCPLHNQTGVDGVHDFDRLIAQMPGATRRAFECERRARREERHHV